MKKNNKNMGGHLAGIEPVQNPILSESLVGKIRVHFPRQHMTLFFASDELKNKYLAKYLKLYGTIWKAQKKAKPRQL